MFNLLMFNVDWSGRAVSVSLERIFERTLPELEARFTQAGQPDFNQLMAYPCIFCEEGTEDQIARVGQINRARVSGREVVLEFAFDVDVPPLRNSFLNTHRVELDMDGGWGFHRNHWAVKDIDLYRFLFRNLNQRRQRPTVFDIPEHQEIEPVLVSAMMPFDAAFNEVYLSIQQAAEGAGMRCRRADDIWENPAVIQDVVMLIDRSRVVVCDCSGRNPNVFYEAGIAHTLGRDVVLITQSEHDIPFDLRHLRYIQYHNNGEGRARLAEALQGRMQTLLGH